MVRVKNLYVDIKAEDVYVGGNLVKGIAPKAFDVLKALVLAEGAICSRDVLCAAAKIKKGHGAQALRSVDQYIRQLRKKLGAGLIETRPMRGYQIRKEKVHAA